MSNNANKTCTRDAPTCGAEGFCCYKVSTTAPASAVDPTNSDVVVALGFGFPTTAEALDSFVCAGKEEDSVKEWVALKDKQAVIDMGLVYTWSCLSGATKLVAAASAALAVVAAY